MKIKQILFFLVFSLLYCFLLIDRTFYNLSGDNLNIGTIVYHLLYPENYSEDFVNITKGTYYLPLFINTCCFIQKLTGNYILTLQIILFIQLFFTLLTTSYMIKELFRIGYGLKNTGLTLLICMTFVILPSGELIGFGTLVSAVARYSFGIFIPLIIVFYYKVDEYIIFDKKISSILIVGVFFGILISFHPPSALIFYSAFLVHWFFYRSSWRRKILPALMKCILSGILFCVFSSVYVLPYLKNYYMAPSTQVSHMPPKTKITEKLALPTGKNVESMIQNRNEKVENPARKIDINKYFENILNFNFFTRFNKENFIFCVRQIFFLSFAIPFILLLFYKHKKIKEVENPEVLDFLKSLFIVGFITMAIGAFISVTFYFGPYFYAFRRADKFLFYILELLVIYFLVSGKNIITNKVMRFFICAGLIFHLVLISKSKGIFQYDIFSKYIPFLKNTNLEEKTLFVNIILVTLIILIILIYKIRLINYKRFMAIISTILILILFLWPVISGGIVLTLNHTLNSFNGLGAWKIVSMIGFSKAYPKMSDFENVCDWVSKTTPMNTKFMFFDDDKAHNMKLLSKRSGVGIIEEVGVIPAVHTKVARFYFTNKTTESLIALANEYNLEYILANNEYILRYLSDRDKFKVEYSGKYYSVLKIIRKSNNEKI